MERLDLVVIGAGWHGLAAAKTYLQLEPRANATVVDSSSSVGGVWSKEKIYPGLQSNNLLGTYEYGDFPMDAEKYGLKPRKPIPGHIVQRYLHDFAEKFDILPKVRLQTKVESAEHQEGAGWVLSLSITNKDGKVIPGQIFTQKLIVATGMTSDPAPPTFEGMETFGAPVFHPRDVTVYKKTLSEARRVCVYGGSKSACDAVYAFGSRGAQVDWVIRESGHGPAWMSPPFVTPLKKWLEQLPHTRLLTWFSPCIWGNVDGYYTIRGFLHSTRIGRWLVDRFWDILGNDVATLNKYDQHPETAKLKPWTQPMFVASSIGILNYETDLYDIVRKGTAKVYVADIMTLGPKTINLSSGDRLRVDALIACTGWTAIPPIKFLPEGIELGLPKSSPPSLDQQKVVLKADDEILETFPRLKHQPTRNPRLKPRQVVGADKQLTSYNLYRFMVPPNAYADRDIAFAGAQMSFFTPQLAQAQALWITAYLTRSPHLTLPHSQDAMAYESILHNRFGKWRCPQGFGEKFPDFVFDALPYVDLLLGDLGLNKWRKNGMLAECLSAYGPGDYRALVEEFQALDDKGTGGETRKNV